MDQAAYQYYTFDGYGHPLINAGNATGGTAVYRLSTDTYSTAIPKASEPGTYTIYYMIVGDGNHADTKEASLNATIKEYVWNGTDVKEPKKVGSSYQIYLPSELAWVAKNNTSKSEFYGSTIELKHDIDLKGKPWTPIGSSSNPFRGVFEGNGYTISTLSTYFIVPGPVRKYLGGFHL